LEASCKIFRQIYITTYWGTIDCLGHNARILRLDAYITFSKRKQKIERTDHHGTIRLNCWNHPPRNYCGRNNQQGSEWKSKALSRVVFHSRIGNGSADLWRTSRTASGNSEPQSERSNMLAPVHVLLCAGVLFDSSIFYDKGNEIRTRSWSQRATARGSRLTLGRRKMKMNIVEMTLAHYDQVLELMRRTPGVAVRDADSPEATRRYLERNPSLNFVAVADGSVVGCAMCGHDGRRGYLQHVVVDPAYRSQGIAHQMVMRCLDGLEAIGICKTHIDVFRTNNVANSYWTRRGWKRRDDIYRYSYNRSGNENAKYPGLTPFF
jgi:ribosomal protein S18 acetylase RimI-like enzyme